MRSFSRNTSIDLWFWNTDDFYKKYFYRKTRDRTPEEANSDEETRRKRKRDRHSKDESKKSKKHSRKAKSRDRDRRNVEKSSEDQTEKPEVSKKETITEPKNSDEVSLEANGSPVRTKRKRDEGSDTEDKSKITNDNKVSRGRN